MKNKELHNSFSEEVKQNPAKCKTQEEVKKGSEEADVRHLDDEVGVLRWKRTMLEETCMNFNDLKNRLSEKQKERLRNGLQLPW